MDARRCHKCGSVMLPSKIWRFNLVFTQTEFECTKCHKKIHIAGKMMTGASIFTGALGLISGNPLYVVGGIFVVLSPVYRKLRNPLMSDETLALGLGIIPDRSAIDIAPAKPEKAASERRSKAYDAAEDAIDRAIAARGATATVAVSRPVAAAERFHGSRSSGDAGFGRRRVPSRT